VTKTKKTKPKPINYRQTYVCTSCKASGLKLWRDYNTIASACELKCAACATPAQVAYEAKTYTEQNRESLGTLDADGMFMFRGGDQLGGLVPAVPTPEGDTFWGYSSVPTEDVLWWYTLPTYQGHALELRCLQQLLRKNRDKYVAQRQQVLRLCGKADEARRQLRLRVEPVAITKLSPDELAALAIVSATSTDVDACRQQLLRLMTINGELGKMQLDLYRQIDDLEWKIERRVFSFTQPTKVLVYDTEIVESEGLRMYKPVERYRDVTRDDRVAFTEGNERAFLLDPKDDSWRKAYVIMEHDQDGARWVREQILAGVLTEYRRLV
jgi:hypothetical protein